MDRIKQKKKVLIAVVHRPDRSPSQRFRFEQYLSFLEENGYSFDFSYLLDPQDDKIFYSQGNVLGKARIAFASIWKRFKESIKLSQYDIVFVQREAIMLGTSFFEKKVAKSQAKLIFDFDDSIWLQNVSEANKKFAFLKNPNKTAEIIQVSDLVIAGNPYLKDYAKNYNQNVIIIPTTIDTDAYKPHRTTPIDNDKITIGWSGSITTVQHFRYIKQALEIIYKKYQDKVIFRLIGDANYKDDTLPVVALPWIAQKEVEEISNFDVGIMPLPDDEWAKGKCGLKGLQYMALEVPTIMSPVGVNSEIIQDGQNGLLAASTEEWVEKLSLLIDNPELRIQLGKAGRKTVVEKYSVEANKNLYLQTFDKILAQ